MALEVKNHKMQALSLRSVLLIFDVVLISQRGLTNEGKAQTDRYYNNITSKDLFLRHLHDLFLDNRMMQMYLFHIL